MKRAIRFGRSGLAAAVLLVGMAGCGSGSSGSALCNDTIQANCDKLFTCAEASADAKTSAGGSKTQCVSEMGIFCGGASSGTCSGGESYHADKAQQCADQTKSASCAASFDADGFLKSPDACSQVCS